MISDGTYMYIWSSGMPTGIKMSIEAAKMPLQILKQIKCKYKSRSKSNCNPWAPDASKFTLPSDIQFRDMSQLLQQVAPSKEQQLLRRRKPAVLLAIR